jgi:hypothetical protein
VKGASGLVVVLLLVVVVIYFMQSGAPETGGLGDAADNLRPTDPGGAAEKGADKVADGAKGGADKVATGIAPWIADNGLVVAAGVLGALALAFYKKHKIMSIVILTAAAAAFIVSLAT